MSAKIVNSNRRTQVDERTGFWVAEDRGSGGALVGTIAVTVKRDPDMREPPNSVAQIRRMAVARSCRRRGVGQMLLNEAISHCHRHRYRAVELITSEHHHEARNLYLKRGFQILRTYSTDYLFGLISWQMHRYRLPCCNNLSGEGRPSSPAQLDSPS